MKKSIIFLVLVILFGTILSLCVISCSSESKISNEIPELKLTDFDIRPSRLYLQGSTEAVPGLLNLYFKDTQSQIPYIRISDAIWLLKTFRQLPITFDTSGESFKIINTKTNASMTIDVTCKKIIYSDIDSFLQENDMVTCNDTVRTKDFIKHIANEGYEINGGTFTIDLAKYNIDMYYGIVKEKESENPDVLIPLRTLLDITPNMISLLTYNGKDCFLTSYSSFLDSDKNNLSELGKIYFNNAPTFRTRDLTDFNYNELMLNLDVNYGLKSRKGISDFDESVTKWGLKEKLLSEDSTVYSNALCELIDHYLGDLHSSFEFMTPYSEVFTTHTSLVNSPSKIELIRCRDEMKEARQKVMGNKYPCLEIIKTEYNNYSGTPQSGTTAFVTFDTFAIDRTQTYESRQTKDYDRCFTKTSDTDYIRYFTNDNIATDTIDLIVFANKKIREWDAENPSYPVKNVVVDLSCNAGGVFDVTAFIGCWMLGKTPISIQNPVTGSKSTTYYYADVNMNGQFDYEKDKTSNGDTILDKNVYLITSKVSFSCGNFLPYVIKNSRRGTLLGSWTGGGACLVLETASADGALFNISGNRQLCYESNGSYVDVDNGIDVDYKFQNPDSYFDRNAIVYKINNIYNVKSIV